jgi:hypothetical protein
LPCRSLGLRHPFWQVESTTHRTTIAQRDRIKIGPACCVP